MTTSKNINKNGFCSNRFIADGFVENPAQLILPWFFSNRCIAEGFSDNLPQSLLCVQKCLVKDVLQKLNNCLAIHAKM